MGTVKRVVVVILIIIVVWTAARIYNQKTTEGKSFLWLANPVSGVTILSTRDDIFQMTHSLITDRIKLITRLQPQYFPQVVGSVMFECTLRPESELTGETIIDWREKRFAPWIKFYYQKVIDEQSGKKIEIITDFCCSPALIFLITDNATAETFPTLLHYMEMKEADANAEVLKQIIQDFQKLNEEHYRSYDFVYSVTEARSLQSFVGAYVVLSKIIEAKLQHYQNVDQKLLASIKQDIEATRINWPLAYYQYFSERHRSELWRTAINNRLLFAGLVLLLLVLVLHFVNQELLTIIRQEQQRVDLRPTWRLTWSLTVGHWLYLIIPLRPKRTQQAIVTACRQLARQQIDTELTAKTEESWQAIKGLGRIDNYRQLRRAYRIASHPGYPTRQRQKALKQLWAAQKRFSKLREQPTVQPVKVKPAPVITQPPPIIKHQRGESRRQKAIKRVEGLLPDNFKRPFWSDFSLATILLLERALKTLPQVDPQAVSVLLQRSDLEILLQRNSLFAQAIRFGNAQAIRKILGLTVEERVKTEPVAKIDYSNLLAGLKVIIVGGRIIVQKKGELCQAIIDLGAEECQFIESSEQRRIEAAAETNRREKTLFVLFTLGEHRALQMLNRRGVKRKILVDKTNPDRFKEQVITVFCQLTRQNTH